MLPVFVLAIISCNGGKETPESIAKKWCELNGKVHNAADVAAKDVAKEARRKYEKEIEEKYKDNKDFMDKVEKASEACEAESEGRK